MSWEEIITKLELNLGKYGLCVPDVFKLRRKGCKWEFRKTATAVLMKQNKLCNTYPRKVISEHSKLRDI